MPVRRNPACSHGTQSDPLAKVHTFADHAPMDREIRTLDLLCRVVDNYGDIGLVYRLARALSEATPALRLRIIVDDLPAFAQLAPGIDPARDLQFYRGWTVVRWNPSGAAEVAATAAAAVATGAAGGRSPSAGSEAPAAVRELFLAERPRHLIECFACGRPDWFEEILFDPSDPVTRHIVNLEYLSAETWVDEVHRMPSLTRSPLVKKYMFMPGFTERTGGLVVDRGFARSLEALRGGSSRREARRILAGRIGVDLPGKSSGAGIAGESRDEPEVPAEDRFWITVFSYERDYSRIVADLAAFDAATPLLVLAAAGRSQACFLDAWRSAGSPFPVAPLPFLPQEPWDEVLLASDFSIVRGEESLARAALSGRPFLWHAYVQENAHQLVKVRALLDRMRPFFDPASFPLLERLFVAFNDRLRDDPHRGGGEDFLSVLSCAQALAGGFSAFSEDLSSHGDLASHLLTFLRELL